MRTDLDKRVSRALEKIKSSGTLDLKELLGEIAPAPKPFPAPSQVPLSRVITATQQVAIDSLPEVFGKVVPTERRELEVKEIPLLMQERLTLDQVSKMANERIEDIKVIVHNHLDSEVEQEFQSQEEQDSAPRDAKGYYVHPGKVPDLESGKAFTREVREASPSLDAEALKALVDDGDLDHDQYLSMTTQTRVLDEAKVLLAVRKHPELVKALAMATRPGGKTTAIYVRNAS
jgi:hypothetical protein